MSNPSSSGNGRRPSCTNNPSHIRSYNDIQWPLLNGLTSPTLVGVAPSQYFPDGLNIERYNMTVSSGSLLSNRGTPPAPLPAPIFGQKWRNPRQSMGQDPLEPTPAVLNANPYMCSGDIQLTQVSCVPGPVDNCLTCAGSIDPPPHPDYSIDYVSLPPELRSYTLVMKYMSFPSSNPH